jgi:quinol monooxygenase YgiN
MIVVNARLESSAADIEAMKEAIATMETASRAESGCLDYTFSVEVSDPNVIRITEKWETMDALAAHFKEPHMADFQAAMAAHPPKGMDAGFYEATDVQPPM